MLRYVAVQTPHQDPQLQDDIQDVRLELKLSASSRYFAWLQMPIARSFGWLTGCKRLVMRIELRVVHGVGRWMRAVARPAPITLRRLCVQSCSHSPSMYLQLMSPHPSDMGKLELSWTKWVDKRWYDQCLNEVRCLIVCDFASSDNFRYCTRPMYWQFRNSCDFLFACHAHALLCCALS